MFVEHKEQGEPSRELGGKHDLSKMSGAMRRGIDLCQGIRMAMYFDNRVCGACAVATALVGYYGSYSAAHENSWEGGVSTGDTVSRLFRVPYGTVLMASGRYERGASREEVADWLEAQGY